MLQGLRYTLRRVLFGYKRPSTLLFLLVFVALIYLYLISAWESSEHENVQWKSDREVAYYEQTENVEVVSVQSSWRSADVARRDAIVKAFKHAWRAYERDAMGSDEYHPISRKGKNLSTDGGIGYTIIDAIDTMVLMNLDDEYNTAATWIRDSNSLSFEREGNFNTFETTIRVLGGLLSTYHLTNDMIFLTRAVELGDRLMAAFDTPTGLPLSSVNLAKNVGIPDTWTPNLISTAEAATLQLEFKYLSHLTKDSRYWRKAEKVMSIIHKATMSHHLVPIYMSVHDGTFSRSEIRLGSRGDSYYEYLLKQYLQTNNTEPIYRTMYEGAMKGLHDNLVQTSPTKNMTYIAELLPSVSHSYRLDHKQDHLVCFLAGSLMLGATTTGAVNDRVSIPPLREELTDTGKRDWDTGVALLETCMYTHETETGLSPEIVQFRVVAGDQYPPERDWYIKGSKKGGPSGYDARYMLRPETVESLFIAYRLTGDPRYRNYGWNIFSSIEKHCKLPDGGYATVLDVDTVPVTHDDKQETFFLSETLKYLFLLHEDASVVPLNEYVFNTEAHPLPVFEPLISPQFV